MTLRNDGTRAVRCTLTAHGHLGGTRTCTVARGRSAVVDRPTRLGSYDLVITAGTGTGWTQRYAGRVATL
ncbi:phospholipase domain-containing protein [Actinacidiphila cocklensis]|uniref:phospholipase domain-containing protein n=1 Tax=Actinacidiphila cocklensis TaxID=887465 RepID=UPI003BEEEFB2